MRHVRLNTQACLNVGHTRGSTEPYPQRPLGRGEQGAHIHAGLLQDEGFADGICDLRAAIDEAVGKLRHAVCRNAPAARICKHTQQRFEDSAFRIATLYYLKFYKILMQQFKKLITDRGAVKAESTMPKLDWVLLGSGESTAVGMLQQPWNAACLH